LPRESAALQSTLVSPRPKFAPDPGLQAVGTGPSTASTATGFSYLTAEPFGPFASTTKSTGTPVIPGPVVSLTVTEKLARPLLPAPSVAVHSTVFVPSAKVLPDPGLQLGVTLPLTVSVAETPVKFTLAPAGLVASAVSVPGTVTIGAVVSRTVTVKLPLALLPELSAALQLTVVAPSGNVLPEAGLQLGLKLPLTVSVAETPE
jgi:hypothetical protein